jgi:hypothetical protein
MIFMALASNERVVTHMLHPQWIPRGAVIIGTQDAAYPDE